MGSTTGVDSTPADAARDHDHGIVSRRPGVANYATVMQPAYARVIRTRNVGRERSRPGSSAAESSVGCTRGASQGGAETMPAAPRRSGPEQQERRGYPCRSLPIRSSSSPRTADSRARSAPSPSRPHAPPAPPTSRPRPCRRRSASTGPATAVSSSTATSTRSPTSRSPSALPATSACSATSPAAARATRSCSITGSGTSTRRATASTTGSCTSAASATSR